MRRVVVVDDEDDIREIAKLSLESFCGWEVTTAASGDDAVAAVREVRPDVVLLDVMMPGQDGITTLRELRSHEATCDVPVVLITAKAQEWDAARLDRLGAAGLIRKPFDPARLGQQVRELLGWGA